MVKGMEWPLNIVFRQAIPRIMPSPDAVEERAVERQPLRPFNRQWQDRHMRHFSTSRPKRPPLRTCGVDVTWIRSEPSSSPILTRPLPIC